VISHARASATQVLDLKLLQALRVLGLQAAVLLAPAVERVFGDLEGPWRPRGSSTFAKHDLGLAELADDLFGVWAFSPIFTGTESPQRSGLNLGAGPNFLGNTKI
jgi:hypothetical protein